MIALGLVALAPAAPVRAGGLEIIPSIGMSKGTDSNAGDAKFSGGLALRAPVLPFLKLEAGIAYRQASLTANNDVTLRVWPVTASAWPTPFPSVYMGGGVGWYRETIDYSAALPFADATTSKLGEHVGAGVLFPIGPKLGLDVSGRYVFMQKDNDLHLPTTFNPDVWSASAGLAIKF